MTEPTVYASCSKPLLSFSESFADLLVSETTCFAKESANLGGVDGLMSYNTLALTF